MSMKKRTNVQRVGDIVERAVLVAKESKRWKTRDALVGSSIERDATLCRLGIIGVAASGISKSYRAKFPGVPWCEVVALRNLLGTPERRLDLDAVWKAMCETVPILLKELAPLAPATVS